MLSTSLSLSLEGDYLILSQFSYNSYPSPLGTNGFLISGIIAVHPKAVVETKSTILLDEAISNFEEILKKLNIILKKLSDTKTRRQQAQTPRSNENHISSNVLAITFPKSIKVNFPRFKGEEFAA